MKTFSLKILARVIASFLCVGAGLGLAQFASAAISPSEQVVLDNLFRQTNGSSWTNHTNWENHEDPCSSTLPWFGVSCDVGRTHVARIFLPTNNLRGSLPTIANLTELQPFDVAGNSLSGSMPDLTGMTHLQSFEAFSNRLTGMIPPLDSLTGLQFFSVFGNRLTGSIPPLAGATRLRNFIVNSNQLTGRIPPLAGLPFLQQFFVDGNGLTGALPSRRHHSPRAVRDFAQIHLSPRYRLPARMTKSGMQPQASLSGRWIAPRSQSW